MNRFIILSGFLLAAAALSACTPTEATRGNIVEDYRIAEVVPGISTRQNVLQSMGSPSTQAPFDDNVWYYIGQKTEKRGILDPKVIDKKVIVVSFDEQGIVQAVDNVTADAIDVPHVRRKTPTSGNEMSVMQQLLGNVGRFNAPKQNSASTATGGND